MGLRGWLVCASVMVFLSPVAGQEYELREVGAWGYGPCRTGCLVGGRVYAGSGRMLVVLDVSSPEEVRELGAVALPGPVYHVVVAGDMACVALHSAGVALVDVADPAAPEVLGVYDTPGRAYAVALAGELLFVADYRDGLLILDVSDPAQPARLASVDTPERAYGVAVDGDYAYVADGEGGLRVIRVSNPAAPQEVAFVASLDMARGVAAGGGYVYLADGEAGLRIIDMQDPSLPAPVSQLRLGLGYYYDDLRGLALAGDVVYAAAGSNVWRVDVSDREEPVAMGHFNSVGAMEQVSGPTGQGRVAVADTDYGLRLVDFADPAPPQAVGLYVCPDSAKRVRVAGDVAFVGDNSGGIWAVDVSDAARPGRIGYLDLESVSVTDMDLQAPYLYVAGYGGGLRILDVADPTQPEEVGSIYPYGTARGVSVAGSLAYVAIGASGVGIIDVHDPTVPAGFTDWSVAGESTAGVRAVGDDLYLANGVHGLGVADVSDLPIYLGGVDTPDEAVYVQVAGDYAYVADTDGGLRVVNVSSPWAPVETGFLETGGTAREVCVHEGMAYLADSSQLRAIDVSDPAAPVEQAAFSTVGSANGVCTDGRYIYVADQDCGLSILERVPLGTGATVLAPNGGELFHVGQPMAIGWTASGTPAIGVYLYKGGSMFHQIAVGQPATGTLVWTLPLDLPTGEDYMVAVYEWNGGDVVFDASNGMLTILGADLNDDGQVDALDLITAAGFLAERLAELPVRADTADFTGDGRVNVLDVLTLARLLVDGTGGPM